MKSNSRVLRGWRDFGVKATAIILTILLATQMVGTPAFASGALTNKQASEDIATTVDDTGVEPSGTEATDTTVPDEAAGAANEPAPADSTQATEEPVVETVESATEPATETPAADPAANTVLGAEPEPAPAPAVEQDQLASIKLDLADNTSITYDGNAIDDDTNPIEVPANEEFKFTVQAAEGWQIDAVKTVIDGVETELVADENGEYAVAAENVTDALTVKVEGGEVVEASVENGIETSDRRSAIRQTAESPSLYADYAYSLDENFSMDIGDIATIKCERGFLHSHNWHAEGGIEIIWSDGNSAVIRAVYSDDDAKVYCGTYGYSNVSRVHVNYEYYFRNDTTDLGVSIYYSLNGGELQIIPQGEVLKVAENDAKSIVFYVAADKDNGYEFKGISFPSGDQAGNSYSIENAPNILGDIS